MTATPKVLGGRYEVGALLGRGGMAEVHRGYDTRLGRPVAVKLLRLDYVRDHSFLTRFRREAQSAAGLNHPNIVAVYDSGEDTVQDSGGAEMPLPYIVMELVDGHTLREKLDEHGRLESGEAARVTMGVLEALAYSHNHGIIHRDIKPSNVMVTRTGQVKMMDFGIARAVADGAATMTQSSAVIGTAQYFSPEQARGLSVDSRSDLYSAGCMLFELLTGRPPYVGESAIAIAYQHVGEPIPVPSHLNPLVPPALDTVVARALVKDRDHRYQHADQFRADLTAAREGRALAAEPAAAVATQVVPVGPAIPVVPSAAQPAPGDPTSPAEAAYGPGQPGRGGGRRRGWLIALLIALVLLSSAGITYLVMNQNAQPTAPTKVAVPSLVGLSKGSAEDALKAQGLTLTQGATKSDEIKAKDTVLAQNPGPGVEVDSGSTVTVTLSLGPAMATMPDLTTKSKAEALTLLTEAGITATPAISPIDKEKVNKDVVVTQSVPAGQTVKASTVVTLAVATGNTKVPNVVGKNESVAYLSLGEDLGLVVKSVDVPTTAQSSGTILEQSPKDTTVPNGSTITIKVARTPATTPPATTVTTTVYTTSPTPSTSTTTTTTTPAPAPGALGPRGLPGDVTGSRQPGDLPSSGSTPMPQVP